MAALLSVKDYSIRYTPRDSAAHDAVKSVSFEVEPGQFVGLVGESGSGKSTLGNGILQLLQKPAKAVGGTVEFDGADLAKLDADALRKLRWVDLSTVFQSSMNSLNPVIDIGAQFADTFRAHPAAKSPNSTKPLSDDDRAAKMLALVDLDPAVLRSFPHELSGGMKQRVALALALALEPKFVLLDEPTTGLDVLVQRRILDRLRKLQADLGFAVLYISHDIGSVLEIADRVLVMYRGEIVEDRPALEIIDNPHDEYTKALLAAYQESRDLAERRDVAGSPVLAATNLTKTYTSGRGKRGNSITAVEDVSFTLHSGRVTALVGQSGSGKSTIARMLIAIEKPDSGSIIVDGEHVEKLRGRALRTYRSKAQYVFQDPYSSLNPTRTVGYILSRPLRNFAGAKSKKDARAAAEALLEQVGLSPASTYIDKLPSQLSGGQRQRVVIARALAPNPKILVADEPVSSLDVSIRAEILELLRELVDERDLAMLYITHDLLSARSLAHETIVLEKGRIVEQGTTEQVTEHSSAEYTRDLLEAIPDPYRRLGAKAAPTKKAAAPRKERAAID